MSPRHASALARPASPPDDPTPRTIGQRLVEAQRRGDNAAIERLTREALRQPAKFESDHIADFCAALVRRARLEAIAFTAASIFGAEALIVLAWLAARGWP